MIRSCGTFTISMTPQDDETHSMGRLTFDKIFSGDFTGISVGQMLSHRSSVEGSAGYVALERLEGSLDGKRGGFHLMHLGTMQAGDQQLSVSIVPNSGTDDLTGITGTLEIDIKEGVHHYTLSYEFMP
ncbi:DUF3224 domain-containing protein [Temperatibacter marinus]|uniref:DUF3224 domain-containing protein n=1 Tax=Temperatibacter marinus TaxID=1456591 RepID=A0AA52EJL1_9PROT|nr:DUF3224 domain-containing protein [Temperatibacter marinus]WND03717.1 DUF3224 domain-containing protein [Temperatibacter marinus]